MCRKVVITLLAAVVHGHAKEMVSQRPANMQNSIQRVEQAVKASYIHCADLGTRMLHRLCYLAVLRVSLTPLPTRPLATSYEIHLSPARGVRTLTASTSCRGRASGNPCIVTAEAGRRKMHRRKLLASMPLFGLVGSAQWSHAQQEDDVAALLACTQMPVEGLEGLKFCDIAAGKTIVNGFVDADVVRVNFRAASHGTIVAEEKNFFFGFGQGEVCRAFEIAVAGAGHMPPMRIGGTRRVFVSDPALAFGSKGAACNVLGDKCAVYPGATDVVFEVQLTGLKGVTNFGKPLSSGNGYSSTPLLFSQLSED
eukprot:gnl/TRDRNA2_/TRDRNA2_159705_c0_seq2.p1 gnl/TRDRNA2_/TRDRNA2_159705_c0~~gnl/TRDRNA2_/TRDRNA2_159705_c0_seq2.p1  ORF type:complete len:310 (+),score=45.42 gnl/TRDRNA2_/TRDRNA2_159705_c0_seq2:86-1015(+)